MKRKIHYFLTCMAFLCIQGMIAQTKTVSGNVTDAADGSPLPGVNILAQGTTNGTQTDFDGNYTIEASEGDVLVVSYLGMKSQNVTVGSSNTLNVAMEVDASQLDEVVVTALGIKRKEKTLTYAQQSVNGDDLTKTRDINFVNSLEGKVAGVQIKKSSSGAGGSTRIVLRGSKSLSGDSTPLFVIDGIPMSNNKGGQPGMWGGVDEGDGLSAVNPDDIESISILKGSSAAILYGSQGANGVVLITTKSGTKGKAKITINTGFTMENIRELPDLQYKYGAIGNAKESWDTTPGSYDEGYVEDFFQTGYNLVNSISVSGGNDMTTAYFSYGNTSAGGITPTNKYEKNNFTFKQSTKMFNDKVTVTSNLLLATEKTKNRLPSGYYLNPLSGLYMFPRNRNFNDFKNNYEIFDADRNIMLQNWFVVDHHQSNPYWIINKEPRTDESKRLIGSLNISWNIMDNLTFQVRGNYDYREKTIEQQHAAGSNSTNVSPNGAWNYQKFNDELIYTDAILTHNANLGDNFTLNTILGASYQKTLSGVGVSVNTGTTGLIYPNEFYFQNLPDAVLVSSIYGGEVIKQGLFANLVLGYKEMLFLDIAGRNDWASTLALTGNDSYFYPSGGITAIVSEMFDMPEAISFGKFRLSITQVGNEVPFNSISPGANNSITGSGGVSKNTQAPFLDGKPEIISTKEFGADWRFFNNRFGFDFTYYHITSTDQFISVPLEAGEAILGYTSKLINAGEVENKGIELTVSATPVRTEDFEWRTSLNYTKNKNTIVDIGPDHDKIINLGSSEGYTSRLVEGGSYNDIYVLKFLRDDQGRILFDGGKPLRTTEREYIGNLDQDWSLGWNNTFNYKRLSMSMLINGKFGGKVFSQTQSMLDGAGVSLVTAEARDNGGVTVNAVDQTSGTAITSVDAETWFRAIGDRNGVGEAYVYDRTNVRLSQLSLGYNFDVSKWKLPISSATLSFVGNNLWMIYNDAPFDPELALSTNRSAQGLDNFNLPSTRTYGLNLNVSF